MNVAILDVGSNNIKLEVHGVESDGRSELLYSDKVAARLGHEVFLSHKLVEENEQGAIEGLKQFAKMIKSLNCKKTIAVGTAALRETESGQFIKRAQKEAGISVKVIPGSEEARLVYLGALASTQFNGRTFCLVDIGGGSTEVTIADENDVHFVESFRLGTVRLKEMFTSNYEMVRLYVKKILKPRLDEMRAHPIDMGLLTGGTARNLVEMVRHREEVLEEQGLPILETKHLKGLVKELRSMSLAEIKGLAGLDKARADIILPGGELLLAFLDRLDIKRSIVSNKGLRDGVLANHIHKKVNRKIYEQGQQQSRRAALQSLGDKYNIHATHADQCALLAMALFRLLQDDHGIAEELADVMYAAALLHDIGMFIDYDKHHQHSQYLIENSDIRGFSRHEHSLIALVARYHRKGAPKNSHEEYRALDDEDRETVAYMAAILRVADALDRSYTNAVEEITILKRDRKKLVLGLKGKSDLSLELWSAERKKDYFEKTFGIQLGFELR